MATTPDYIRKFQEKNVSTTTVLANNAGEDWVLRDSAEREAITLLHTPPKGKGEDSVDKK